MDFSIVTQAGLTNQEAANIVGVSKVMMWRYTTGQAAPRAVKFKGVDLQGRMKTFLYVLTKLVEKGALPKRDLAWAPKMHPELRAKRDAVVLKIKKLVEERVANQPANE